MNCCFHVNRVAVGFCSGSQCNRALCRECMNAFSPSICPICARSYCLGKIFDAKVALALLAIGFIGGLGVGMTKPTAFPHPLYPAFIGPMVICGIWMFSKFFFNLHLNLILVLLFGLPAVLGMIMVLVFIISASIVILPIMIGINIFSIRKHRKLLRNIVTY